MLAQATKRSNFHTMASLNCEKIYIYLLFTIFFSPELKLTDILNTPSVHKPTNYSRTPGQVMSLISSFGFVSQFLPFCFFHLIVPFVCLLILSFLETQNTPAAGTRRHCSTSAVSCGKMMRTNNSLGSPSVMTKETMSSPAHPAWKKGGA